MQDRYDEGVAIRVGPEPCVDIREGAGEASVGERIGQPLSRESRLSWTPTSSIRRSPASRPPWYPRGNEVKNVQPTRRRRPEPPI